MSSPRTLTLLGWLALVVGGVTALASIPLATGILVAAGVCAWGARRLDRTAPVDLPSAVITLGATATVVIVAAWVLRTVDGETGGSMAGTASSIAATLAIAAVVVARRAMPDGDDTPLWRDAKVLGWVVQFVALAIVVAVIGWLYSNYTANSSRQNLPTSFDFLDQPAGFPIASSDFGQARPVRDAYVEGFKNTLRLALTGIALAMILGVILGVARLSKNILVRSMARAYVEFVRNVPLASIMVLSFLAFVLGLLPPPADTWILGDVAIINVRGVNFVWYDGANWKVLAAVALAVLVAIVVGRWRTGRSERTGRPARTGLWAIPAGAAVLVVVWMGLGLGITTPRREGLRVSGGITMTPAYLAALIALVGYTSSHVAEIVRGSIQAVPKGQGEAADALALSGFQRMWYVILPQALRVGIPPIGNQFLNLAKNSSLAATITFPELTKITQLTVANRSPSVPAYTLTLTIYLVFSLVLSSFVNLANRRLAIVER
ncbi:MAG: ABC transporter permease subunit [Desertimonas sp.]